MSTVQVLPNRREHSIQTGASLPPLFQVESGNSVTLMVDSKDRKFGTEANFIVDLGYRLAAPRYLHLQKITIPKIPNVTPLNNQIQIKHALGTTAVFTIPPGIYNTTTLANALTAAINAGFAAVPIVDTVTTTYDPTSRTFLISSVGFEYWFFVDTCSFITRGKVLCGFTGYPVATAVSISTQYSGIAGMLYCRYLSVSSRSVCTYAEASSASSTTILPGSVIGLVDMAGIYTSEDFDVGVQFSGVYKTLNVDGPNIQQLSSDQTLRQDLDFMIVDSYGSVLDDVLNLGAPYGPNTLGISLLMKIAM